MTEPAAAGAPLAEPPAAPQPVTLPVPGGIVAHAQLVPTPHGPLIALSLNYGHVACTFYLNDDIAEQLGPHIANLLAQGVEELRRVRTGLVIATPDALRQLPPPGGVNGHRPT